MVRPLILLAKSVMDLVAKRRPVLLHARRAVTRELSLLRPAASRREIPQATAELAWKVHPRGTDEMRVRDALGPLFTDIDTRDAGSGNRKGSQASPCVTGEDEHQHVRSGMSVRRVQDFDARVETTTAAPDIGVL